MTSEQRKRMSSLQEHAIFAKVALRWTCKILDFSSKFRVESKFKCITSASLSVVLPLKSQECVIRFVEYTANYYFSLRIQLEGLRLQVYHRQDLLPEFLLQAPFLVRGLSQLQLVPYDAR
jgi:hypothetical protein